MNDKARVFRVFGFGFFLGGALVFAGMHFYGHFCLPPHGMHGPNRMHPKRILEKLSKDLDLDSAQKAQVEKILQAHLPKFKDLRRSVRPQFETIRASIDSEIRAILRPDQQEKFTKIVADLEMRRKKWEEQKEKGE